MRTTILIVDDHDAFRSWAREVLEEAGYEVVGEAEDGESAIRSSSQLRPNVVLLDIQLPDIDGFEVARRLNGARLPPVVVLTSSRAEADYGLRIARSGARGFIPKADISRLALQSVLEGD
jgi:DNA-binding NarL/FixJ family response regulator